MSLASAPYKRLPDISAAALTDTGVLNALFDCLTSATYYDATSRTAKVNNVTKDGATNAVHGGFVASAGGSNVKWVFSIVTGTTLRSPDIGTTYPLVGTMVKNAGAYSSYASAAPFTSGEEFDNWFFGPSGNMSTLRAYEADEGILVMGLGTQFQVYAHWLGALWDPDSTAAADSEYSGRRFGMIVTNGINLLNGGASLFFDSQSFNANTSVWLSHNTNSGSWHAGVQDIGSGTPAPITRMFYPRTTGGLAQLTLPSGRITRTAAIIHGNGTNTIGRLREARYIPSAINGTTLRSGGADIGYVVGGDNAAANNAILLDAA